MATRMIDPGSIELAIPTNLTEELRSLLQASLRITGDKGNVRLFRPADCCLWIVAQSGFDREFLEFFNRVQEGQAACGTALLRRKRIIVENVATDALFAATEDREVLLRAQVRAIHSTPLISPSGSVLGVLSCHYAKPGRVSAADLRDIDGLADEAVRLIEANTHFGPPALRILERAITSGRNYSIFCRTDGCVSFVEATASREMALERTRRLSAREPGEFVLFEHLNVLAVGKRGLLKILSHENPSPIRIPISANLPG